MGKIYMGIIVPCVVILPIAVCLYRKKYWSVQVKILLFYLILSGLFNLIAKITSHSNNLPYLHLYTVLEFTVICLLFKSFAERHMMRVFFNVLISCFLILSVWYAFIGGSLFVFNKIPRFLSSLIITVICIYFLLKDLGSIRSNFSTFQFLTIMGLLFYYSTCSVLFGFSEELLKIPKNIATLMWNIHATLNMLMYIMFTIGFYNLKKINGGL